MLSSYRILRVCNLINLNSRLIKNSTAYSANKICLNYTSNKVKIFEIKNKRSFTAATATLSNENSNSKTNSQSQETFSSSKENEDSDENADDTVEDMILKKALKYVPEFGFTTEAISKGKYHSKNFYYYLKQFK